LRVCADPNNLPFSNRAQQGFENHLADMVANDLGMKVSYYWFPQRSKFFDKTLNAGRCDVVMGLPAGIPVASTTAPYYQSSYVFVSRRDRHLDVKSMDDPRLRQLQIGVHITGDQDASLPPVNALISRGIVKNLVGYSIYGNLGEKNPPSDLIQAVVDKKVDIAITWGPMAGYFAQRAAVPLDVTPVDVVSPNPKMPFTFSIAMGVRQGDQQLQNESMPETFVHHQLAHLKRCINASWLQFKPIGRVRCSPVTHERWTRSRRPGSSRWSDQSVWWRSGCDAGRPQTVQLVQLLRLSWRSRWRRDGTKPARQDLALR
jgi:quinoprotein dehydrogenase-associated probable ABC transporter substrate-binding protein